MFDDSFRIRYKSVPVAIRENTKYFSTPPHNHSELEIICVDKGSTNVRINGQSFTASSGDILFFNPLEVHALLPDHDTPYVHRCICLDCSLIGDDYIAQQLRCGELAIPWRITPDNQHNGQILQFVNSIYNNVQKDSETVSLEVPAYVSLMIAYMLNWGIIRDNRFRLENTVFCDRVLQLIAEKYTTDITSKQAAELLNFNQSYFCRAFRKHFGMTFSDYLNSYRVSISKQLLDEKKTVTEVALACGYTNPEYYSRAFKKYMGILPTQYKKSIRYG